MRARAVWFTGPRVVEVRECPLRRLGDGDVLVATCYSGISAGTELLAYRGEVHPDLTLDETLDGLPGTFSYPFRYGYSCVGRVAASRAALAEGSLVFAFHPHQDRFAAPASEVVPLGNADVRTATLFPLVETALQLSLDAGPVDHEPVAVLGLGVVGLLTAALLQRRGATVVGADPREDRRRAAAAFSVTAVTPEDLPDAVAEQTAGQGVSLLVEASGNPEALASGLALVAHEGTALVASWYGTRPVTLPLGGAFHRRRLCIRSSQVSTIPARLRTRWSVPRRRAVARALMDELPLASLATHAFALDQVKEAFAAVDRGEPGLLHAALRYP